MREEWRDIKEYEGLYQVSNLGRVKGLARYDSIGSFRCEKIMKQSLVRNYPGLTLSKNGKRRMFKVHRLVAEAFIPNTDNKPQVNHIDGNKTNNHYLNLEWVTPKENIHHSYENKLTNHYSKNIIISKNSSKLEFSSCKEAAEHIGCNINTISDVLNKTMKYDKKYKKWYRRANSAKGWDVKLKREVK